MSTSLGGSWRTSLQPTPRASGTASTTVRSRASSTQSRRSTSPLSPGTCRPPLRSWATQCYHGVAQERRVGRQGPSAGGDVERRACVDEALERTVVDAVPDARGVGWRLVRHDPPSEVDIEPPEVDQLAGGVDLGLVAGLGLAQHRGGDNPCPPWPGKQVGRLEQDGRAIVEGQGTPGGCRRHGRRDCSLGLGLGRLPHCPEDLLVGVRLAHVDLLAGTGDPLATDRVRQIHAATAQLGQSCLELSAFGTARRIVQNRLVDWGRNLGHSIHHGEHLLKGLSAFEVAAHRVTRHRRASTTGSSVTSYHSRSSSWASSPSTWKDAIRLRATDSEIDTADSMTESPGAAWACTDTERRLTLTVAARMPSTSVTAARRAAATPRRVKATSSWAPASSVATGNRETRGRFSSATSRRTPRTRRAAAATR